MQIFHGVAAQAHPRRCTFVAASCKVFARPGGATGVAAGAGPALGSAEAPSRGVPVGGQLRAPDAAERRGRGGAWRAHAIVALLVVRGDEHLKHTQPISQELTDQSCCA